MAEGGAGGKEVGRISIRVVPNLDKFHGELRDKLEAIEKELKCEIKIVPNMDGFREKVRAETARLPEAKVKIKADVDRSSFALSKLFDGAGSGGAGAGGGLGMLADQTVLIAIAVVALLAPALALLSGILVTLPALLSAVLVPVGALALGFKGIGDALAESGLMTTDKKGKHGLGAGLKTIQESVSGVFKTGLTPVFDKLAVTMGPLANATLPKVAQGIVDVAKAITDVVTSGPGMASITNIIESIGATISRSAPGLASFTGGILTLADKVSAKFPGLADTFSKWGKSFNDWVTAQSSPKIGAGIEGKTPLDTAMSNLGNTLKELGGIAVDMLKQGFEWLSDPKFGDKMHQFVADLRLFVKEVLPEFKKAFEDVADAVHEIMKIATLKLPDWISDHRNDPTPHQNQGIGQGHTLGSAQPGGGMDPQRDWTTAGDDLSNSIANQMRKVPGAVLAAISGAASAVGEAGAKLVGMLLDGIVSAADTVGQAGAKLVGFFAQGVIGAADAVGQAAATLVGKLVSGLEGLASRLEQAGINAAQGFVRGVLSVNIPEIGAGIGKGFAGHVGKSLGINSPSTVMHAHGVNTMLGLQNGLDGGLQGVIDRAKSVAQQVSDALAQGVDPKGLSDQVKKSMQELNLERDQLKVQLDATTDKGAQKQLRDQIKQVNTAEDQLRLQGDQLKVTDQYGKQAEKNNQLLTQPLTQGINSIAGITQSTIMAQLSDLGVSGNGAIPTIASTGIGWLTQMLGQFATSALGGGGGATHIQVNSVDEALAAKQTIANRQALQFAGR